MATVGVKGTGYKHAFCNHHDFQFCIYCKRTFKEGLRVCSIKHCDPNTKTAGDAI